MAFSTSRSMWLEQLWQGTHVASYLLAAAACPVHCGGSSWPWFVAGLSVGVLVGLCCAGGLLFLWTSAATRVSFPGPPSPVHSHPTHLRRRLSAYLE